MYFTVGNKEMARVEPSERAMLADGLGFPLYEGPPREKHYKLSGDRAFTVAGTGDVFKLQGSRLGPIKF